MSPTVYTHKAFVASHTYTFYTLLSIYTNPEVSDTTKLTRVTRLAT